MNITFNKGLFLVLPAVIVGVFAIVSVVSAATTIGTNINTDGSGTFGGPVTSTGDVTALQSDASDSGDYGGGFNAIYGDTNVAMFIDGRNGGKGGIEVNGPDGIGDFTFYLKTFKVLVGSNDNSFTLNEDGSATFPNGSNSVVINGDNGVLYSHKSGSNVTLNSPDAALQVDDGQNGLFVHSQGGAIASDYYTIDHTTTADAAFSASDFYFNVGDSGGTNALTLNNDGSALFAGPITTTIIKTTPVAVSALPTCDSGETGATAYVTDSDTNTWGAAVAGSGANNVGVSCNGTDWTVFSK